MPRILSLDTSTSICSAAIHHTGKLLAFSEIHEEQSHGSKLAILIDALFNTLGIDPQSLQAIAVTSGPGSYTGLRIGTSTAKGLCYSLGIPLVSVDTLKILTLKVIKLNAFADHLFCPMIDAKRMEVYCSVLDNAFNVIEPIQAKAVEPGAFDDLLENNKIVFFGDGASKCEMVITHPNARFIHNITPSATELGELALTKVNLNQTEDLIHFEPFYLKEFQIKKSTKLNGAMNK